MADGSERERESDFYREIRSLRERCHTLAGDAATFQLEIKLWQREVNEQMAIAKKHIDTYEPLVDSMREADKIATALEANTAAQKEAARAAAQNSRDASTLRLTRTQTLGGLAIGGFALADIILRLVS